MTITKQHTQESLSYAYIRALAGLAGVNVSITREYDYGIDGTWHPVVIKNRRRIESGFPVDFQLKSTVNWRQSADDIRYALEVKTYNDLVTREAAAIPCVLVLLCLPEDEGTWLNVIEDAMTLRHCCYWVRLPPGPASTNDESCTIRIPRANLLDVAALTAILDEERNRWRVTA